MYAPKNTTQGPNSTAHNRQVVEALINGVAADGIVHNFIRKSGNFQVSKLRSTGTGLNFWFLDDEGKAVSNEKPTIPAAYGDMSATFYTEVDGTYPLPIDCSTSMTFELNNPSQKPTWLTLTSSDGKGTLSGKPHNPRDITASPVQLDIKVTYATGSVVIPFYYTVAIGTPSTDFSASKITFVQGIPRKELITFVNSPTTVNVPELNPAWLGLSLTNEGNGVYAIGGTPTGSGTRTVTLNASNSTGNMAGKSIQLEVLPNVPVITNPGDQDGTKNVQFGPLKLVATNNPIEWEVAGGGAGLPDGLTLDSNTGEITGTPTGTTDASGVTVYFRARNAIDWGDAIGIKFIILADSKLRIDIVPVN